MPRGPQVDIAIKERVLAMIAEGERRPAAIHRQLQREFPPSPLGKDAAPGIHVPHVRTIARLVREYSPPDLSGPWSLATDQTGRPEVVLPVALAVAEHTRGRMRLTHDLAAWVVRVVAVAPGIPAWTAYRFARHYQVVAVTGGDTYPLDLQLACEVWTLPGRQQWQRLVERTGELAAARAAVVAAYGPEAVAEEPAKEGDG